MNGMPFFSSLVILLFCASLFQLVRRVVRSAIKLSEMLLDVAVTELGSTPPSHFRCSRSAALDTDVGIWLARR